MEKPASDPDERLRAELRRVAGRVRRRRTADALTIVGLVGSAALAALGAWCAVRGVDLWPALAAVAPALLLAALCYVGVALLRPVASLWVAREVDRRLALDDRAAAALAVVDGRVSSALGDVVTRDALRALDERRERLDDAFPAVPSRVVRPVARYAAYAVLVALALVALSRLVPAGGDLALPGLAGDEPAATPGDDGAPGAAADESQEPDPDEPDEATDDDQTEPPVAEPPPEPPPEPPNGPGARASVVMSGEEFEPTDTVLALVSVWPSDDLERPRGYRLLLEIDGRVVDTGESLALAPHRASGLHRPIVLNHLENGSEFLQPGEHEVVALLEPEDGGPGVRSEPARYRVRGDDGGGGGGGREPDADGGADGGADDAQPDAEPPPAAPEGGGQDEADSGPAEDEPVDLPEESETKVVVPLMGEGEEVQKEGPRLVLSPGGGREREPQRQPLEEALPEARRRAEDAVDRAGVRAADRDLVRRYFERLLRLSRGESR